jgi:GNAT superfamily N-acetyltransferase
LEDFEDNMKIKTIITDEKNQDFINLAKKLWCEYFENVGDTVDKYQEVNNLEGKHFVILIFDEDNENRNNNPIACGSFKEFSKDTVEIKRVFVKQPYRNNGLATFIMGKLEKEAKMRAYDFSILMTGINNIFSQLLYKKLDYKEVEGFGIFKEDPDSVTMRKKLI